MSDIPIIKAKRGRKSKADIAAAALAANAIIISETPSTGAL